ncbi:MAG: hypothetical protein HFJ00_14210 [Lachnospiraceae bacterium]|nr:hypothetical protein [Lachnospiraceae bacterium]
MGDMERGIEEGCFLPRVEDEGQRYGRNKDTAINHTYINSGSYRRKFDFISNSPDLNRLIFQLSKKMLEHRSGTKFEDMYWIDAAHRRVIAKETESCSEEQIVYSNSIRSKISKYENLITLHSHPNSYPPSINDLNSNFINHYGLGIVACHDGKIFKYASNQEIREDYYKMVVEKYLKKGYNEYEAQIEALKELVTKFDIMVKEVTEDGM